MVGIGTERCGWKKVEVATKSTAKTSDAGTQQIRIKPINMCTIRVEIIGTAPLCINKFSRKALQQIAANQAEGRTAKGKKNREAKDFDALYEAAKYISAEGWCGISAPSFRNAAIRACSLVDFKMTIAKMSIFVEADGYDRDDGTPLVKITKGEPECWIAPVRIAMGAPDLRPRPLWREWRATLTLRYDADQFRAEDVVNLIARAGAQVGVGEGRPSSKESNGLGYGLWQVA